MDNTAVIISHGYNSTPLFMKGIEFELRSWGRVDQVINLGLYGSKWWILPNQYNQATPIIKFDEEDDPVLEETIIEHVILQLKDQLDSDIDQVIFLGHSMGGLVFRTLYKAVISKDRFNWLGEKTPTVKAIIQLATPNQGSKLTNLGVIRLFDRLQSSIFLKIAGFSINLVHKFGNLLGLSESKPFEYNVDEETTQIKQMKPGSKYLTWLNSEPTYVDEIPHYVMIGQKNGVFFTNLAWIESADDLKAKEIIDDFNNYEGDDLVEFLKEYELPEHIGDNDLEEFRSYLIEKNGNLVIDDMSVVDQIKVMFKQNDVTPNDGLVSVEDAFLPGATEIPLGEYAERISHHSICMWFLPFKPYRYVRDRVIDIIQKEISRPAQ